MLPHSIAVEQADSRRARAAAIPPAIETADARLERAVHGLLGSRPELSAAGPAAAWQRWALALLVVLAVVSASGILETLTRVAAVALPLLLAAPFGFAAVLRIAALCELGRPSTAACDLQCGFQALPRYSVLVPLLREASVASQLVDGLSRLAYPVERLEILLIVEAFDLETRGALAALVLPRHMRVVVVPDGAPRTKPRALNYALLEATGDLIAVYDGEDIPEPDQLLRAASAFRSGSAKLGCVQARLNIYNPGESWLTRQFTLEYTALFDALLPLLERWDLPVPLGGTSNHFRRSVLEEVGGWDPFNVTEDADLGIRLARHGWQVAVLPSTTWEEAPGTWGKWRNQRTRWLKGWMQTYLVHMRQPLRLARELGAWRFLGFQMLMSAMLLSALLHPWFYVFALHAAWNGALLTAGAGGWGSAMALIAAFNLFAGYAGAVALGHVALRRRGHGSGAWVLALPLYWLAVSAATYRAIHQLLVAPYLWEKTEHRGRGVERANDGGVRAAPSPRLRGKARKDGRR